MAKKIKKTIVFDLDGTLSNFEEIDHKIINFIFGNSKIVMLLDKILWSINRLEVLKNSMWLLKFRLIIYSILSCQRISKCLKIYELEYFSKTYSDFKCNYEKYLKRLTKKYKVLVLSNNMYAKGIEYKGFRVICNTSKFKQIKYLKNRHDVLYVIGNNLLDDVITGNLITEGSIYIGKSNIVKLFATINFENIKDLTNYLLLKSD